MTPADLIAHCQERRDAGQEYVILKLTRPRRPRSEHVRLCGRWLARVVGERPGGVLIVDLPIATVLGPRATAEAGKGGE